jgi:hypothetical protein
MTRTWLVSVYTFAPLWMTLTQYVASCEAAQRTGVRAPVVLGAKCA